MTESVKATRRDWIALAVIALPCMVYTMDLTVLNLALPAISAELRPSASQLLWLVDIYGFLVGGCLITMGSLGDRIGRRRLLMIGAAAFALASIVAAFASSIEMLLAMRALLGVAGATLAPSTMALIRNLFHDPGQRQFAIGVWIASFSTGSMLGPLVGGVLLHFFGWGALFLVAVPVMLLLLVLAPVLLPEYRDPDPAPLDLSSALLSLLAVLACVYGLKTLLERGADPLAGGAILAGVACGVVFVRRQRRLARPLLDLTLLRIGRVKAALTAYGLSCLAMFGITIFITQYLQLVLGLSPLQAGLATVPWSLGFVVGSLAARRLVARLSSDKVLLAGLFVGTLGMALISLVDARHGLTELILGTALMSLGLSPVFAIANELIMGSAPPERAGAASALAETAAEFSGALGIAVFGVLGAQAYRSLVLGGLPHDMSGGAVEQARATLGGALALSAELGEPARSLLVTAARQAHVDALRLIVVLGALVLLGTLIACARLLRADPMTRRGTCPQ